MRQPVRPMSIGFSLVLLLLTAPPLSAQSPPPEPMLPSVYEGEVELSAYWVSEKLDGVRGHWDGESLWSRGGHRFQPPSWFTRDWPDRAMEGELWLGPGRFSEVNGLVRRQDAGEDWREVTFMVFDLPGHGGEFSARVETMRELLADQQHPHLDMIPQFRVANGEALEDRLQAVLDKGGEGLILHREDARYRPGRSPHLLKYKPYNDAEAKIVGYTQGKGKYRNMVGALVVEDATGRRFRLGSGLSDAQRQDPPPLGSWVTYRYNGLTVNGMPRFARFLRVRQQ